MPPREGIYGLIAEFNTPSDLVHATEAAHRAGYRRMECYTPYPVEEAAEALNFHKNRVPLMCLLGGLMGLTTASGFRGAPSACAGPPVNAESSMKIAKRITRAKSLPSAMSAP